MGTPNQIPDLESANIGDVVNQAGTPQPQPQQQQPDPIEQLKQRFAQQATPPPQASGGPIKKLLSNFFGGMGDAMMTDAGVPTNYQKQQKAMTNLATLTNAQAMSNLHDMQAQELALRSKEYEPTPLIGRDGKPMLDQNGKPVMLPANMARGWYAAMPGAQARVEASENMAQSRTDTATINANKPAKPKVGSVDPIIAAQVGNAPDPANFPGGENDPAYKLQSKMWGSQAETIKNRMASASGAARGAAFNMTRTGGYITPEGDLKTATAGEAIAKGYIPATPGFQSMSKQAQFGEMNSASSKLRTAITNLQPGDAFTPAATAQLNIAMRSPDLGTSSNILTQLASSTTNERQQDYIIWLQQMNERILSLRSIAGMGQGASDLRAAVQATLPAITSGNASIALKRLDAVDNQINQLYRGIPKNPVSNPKPAAGGTAPVSGFAAWKAQNAR